MKCLLLMVHCSTISHPVTELGFITEGSLAILETGSYLKCHLKFGSQLSLSPALCDWKRSFVGLVSSCLNPPLVMDTGADEQILVLLDE